MSLYPSAINRLCREQGLPKGKAKRLKKEQFGDWEKFTYSIMTVKINKVNKIQQMPFIAHKTEDSILYKNEAPEEPIIIDNITLEDYINFHDIEYEILDGVYWNEGGNNKMGEIVKELFLERLKYKETNKALANTIKLMLNSAYGKTITKKIKTEKKIISSSNKYYDKKNGKWKVSTNTRFDSYIYNNFNTIKSYRKLNENNYEVEKLCADDSYNRGHIGCAILSMSKRIMNEVFNVANTEKAPIYYTDTDSLHCNLCDVNRINLAYWFEYKKQLTGIQLEQFHTDFALLDKDEKPLQGKNEEIYATKSIFLGKKSYLDCLESKDGDGNIITGHHIRLKGITKEGLEHASKEYKDGYLGLYKYLAEGKTKKFILNPYDEDKEHKKELFQYSKGEVLFKKEFTRDVKFI